MAVHNPLQRTARPGVWKRGWISPKRAKKRPSRACANGIRAPVKMQPFTAPAIDISTVSETSVPPIEPIVRVATMEGLASQYVAHRLPLLQQFDAGVMLELVSIPQTVDLSRKEADVFLSFFNPRTPGLTSKRVGSVAMHLYCSPAYVRRHGEPHTLSELAEHRFVGYIEELLTIDAVRWLDDVVENPRMVFYSNSILAQCNAAIGGLGIVMLPTFVASGVHGLQRLFPDIAVKRDVWLSVRAEQSHLSRIRAVTKFFSHIFEMDREYLLGQGSVSQAAE